MLFQGFASAHDGRHGNSAATALLKLDTGCNGKRWCFTVLAKTVSRAYTGIQTFFEISKTTKNRPAKQFARGGRELIPLLCVRKVTATECILSKAENSFVKFWHGLWGGACCLSSGFDFMNKNCRVCLR